MFIIPVASTAKTLMVITISLHPGAHQVPASYTVQQGDTLSSIAVRAYDSAADWPAVWWANRRQLPDPDVIAAGQRLQLPASAQVPAWMARAAQAAVLALVCPGPAAVSVPKADPAGHRAGLYRGPGVLGRGELVGHRGV